MSIAYQAGYKYQLVEDYLISLPEFRTAPGKPINTTYIALSPDGELCIRSGYAWDGPSGPAIDTKNFMRGSLVHDVLYQLIREGHLPAAPCRRLADQVLRRFCREDGMSALRGWWVYVGVRWGGGPAANPTHDKPVLRAP